MEKRIRPAARVVCVDAGGRILLIRWCDPATGDHLWEPPGGGIEPGETPLDAARRELSEETGLDPAAVADRGVTVERDVLWNGVRWIGAERFFLARFDQEQPPPAGAGLSEQERRDLQEYAWIPATELGTLVDPVQPPELGDVLDRLLAGQDPAVGRESGR